MTLRNLKEAGIIISKNVFYYYSDEDLDIMFGLEEEKALDQEIIAILCCDDCLQIEVAPLIEG